MRFPNPIHVRRPIALFAVAGVALSCFIAAQAAEPPLPVTAELNHRIRFDNGFVRMYEVELPKGKSTAFHEHQADNFQVFFADTTVVVELKDGPLRAPRVKAGQVVFSSTEKGPYTHRVEGGGDPSFHVIAMELLGNMPEPESKNAPNRPEPAFEVVQENMRGRAYKMVLAPGVTSPTFTRPARTAIFAISSGRIRELADGKAARLWDFDPANFRWVDAAEQLRVTNEGTTSVELVEIEVR